MVETHIQIHNNVYSSWKQQQQNVVSKNDIYLFKINQFNDDFKDIRNAYRVHSVTEINSDQVLLVRLLLIAFLLKCLCFKNSDILTFFN